MVVGLGDEPLDLLAVEIHRDEAIGTRGHEEVADQTGGDRLTGTALAVLAGIGEERDDGGDALGRSPLQGVHHHQLLHDVVVQRRAVALDDEAVGTAHALGVADVDLAVREDLPLGLAQLDTEQVGDLVGEGRIGRPREQHEPLASLQLHGRQSPFFSDFRARRAA